MTTCKECGANFDEHLSACPFCGAPNYSGSKKRFRIIMTTLCCLFLAAGLFTGIFFMIRSASFKSESYELSKAQMLWRNQYMDGLDEMYADGDYDGIIAFLNEHADDAGFFPYGWEHLDFIELYASYIAYKDEASMWGDRNYYVSEFATCLYSAASVDYAAEQDFFTYTEEEQELIASYQEETARFYRETLELTDDEIVLMKSEIASDDDGNPAIPTYENCRNYIIKIKDRLLY